MQGCSCKASGQSPVSAVLSAIVSGAVAAPDRMARIASVPVGPYGPCRCRLRDRYPDIPQCASDRASSGPLRPIGGAVRHNPRILWDTRGILSRCLRCPVPTLAPFGPVTARWPDPVRLSGRVPCLAPCGPLSPGHPVAVAGVTSVPAVAQCAVRVSRPERFGGAVGLRLLG